MGSKETKKIIKKRREKRTIFLMVCLISSIFIKRKHTCERISPKKTEILTFWEYFGFKETSLDVKDCRIEPEFVQKDEQAYFICLCVPYLALA